MPTRALNLMGDFESAVGLVEAEMGGSRAIADYESCMHEGGFEGDAYGYSEVANSLVNYAPVPADTPPLDVADFDGYTAWNAYLDLESEAMATDADCRADIYTQGMSTLDPQLQSFRLTHADDLEHVQSDWDDMVARAETLGWEPSVQGQ